VTDVADSPRCPADDSTLEAVDVDEGVVFVCRECQGIWLPAAVVQALAVPFKTGWTGYMPFDEDAPSGAACPAGHGALKAFRHWIYAVELCGECGAVWLPGLVLRELNDRTRREDGADLIPWAPESYLLGQAAMAVGVHPQVVQDLVTDSNSVWAR
jgi:Zn-finger nucleic acid-binding protein